MLESLRDLRRNALGDGFSGHGQNMTQQINRRSIWTLIFVDLFARVSYGFARTPLLALYAAFLGAGPEMIGVVGAAATITGVVLKLPAGAISDVIGRRIVLLAGLVIFATGPFLYVLADSPASLMGVRFFHGLATAIYGPVSMAAVAALAEGRRGEYISWLSNTKILGKLVGSFLGGLILSAGLVQMNLLSLEGLAKLFDGSVLAGLEYTKDDFVQAYYICGGMGALALVLGLLVISGKNLGETPDEKKKTFAGVWKKFSGGIREMVSNVRVLVASGCEGVQNLTVGVIEHFLPIYAVFGAGMTAFEACLLYASQAITTIACKPMFGRWSDQRGRKGVIVLGMLLCAAPFALIPWTVDFWTLFALCLVFGLGEALVTSSSAALVTDLCEKRHLGAAMGVFGMVHDTGHAAGPILGGFLILAFAPSGAPAAEKLADAEPYRIAFAIISGILVLYTLAFAMMREKDNPGETTS
ncbi:MAG: MFS transporter [Planctomycetes bacterium]|nr:MFS transporter [Planctomycetota bacterium]